jgi:hypothetical protein
MSRGFAVSRTEVVELSNLLGSWKMIGNALRWVVGPLVYILSSKTVKKTLAF